MVFDRNRYDSLLMGVGMNSADLEFLSKTQYFSGCSKEQLEQFANHFTIYFFQEDEELFSEGDLGGGWYLLREGEVGIVRSSAGGPPHVLAELGEGEAFGEIGLLEKTPRMASVVALTYVRVFKMEDEVFDKLLKEFDPIAVKMLREMAIAQSRRLREITTILQDITDPVNEPMPAIGGPLDVNSFIRSNLLLNIHGDHHD